MRRTHLLAVVVAALIAVAGCAGASADDDAGELPPLSEMAEMGDEELYVTYVRANIAPTELSDQDLVDVAEATCRALDRGKTAEQIADDVFEVFTDNNDRDDMAVIIGAGVVTYCPEYMDEFDT